MPTLLNKLLVKCSFKTHRLSKYFKRV